MKTAHFFLVLFIAVSPACFAGQEDIRDPGGIKPSVQVEAAQPDPAEKAHLPLSSRQLLEPLTPVNIADGWSSAVPGLYIKDITVGQGKNVADGKFVSYRFSIFGYDPKASDFKDPKIKPSPQYTFRIQASNDGFKKEQDKFEKLTHKSLNANVLQWPAISTAVVGMNVGGRRLIAYFGTLYVEVLEIEVLDVVSDPKEWAEADQRAASAGRVKLNAEEMQAVKKEWKKEEARMQAEFEAVRSHASEAYPALIEKAKSKAKADPVIFGIVFGEKWHGVQDVNDCRWEGWDVRSNIPFCLYDQPSAEDLNSPWGTVRVRVSEKKFDTSWVRPPYVEKKPQDNSAGSELALLMARMNDAKRCYVEVSIMSNNTVGRVSMYTSLKNEDVDAVIRLLTEKYGKNFKHEDKERTDGIKTGQWMWELPGFYIIYHQQAQIPGGHAFDGGYLEIYTQEWKDFQAELESKNAKPDL